MWRGMSQQRAVGVPTRVFMPTAAGCTLCGCAQVCVDWCRLQSGLKRATQPRPGVREKFKHKEELALVVGPRSELPKINTYVDGQPRPQQVSHSTVQLEIT